MDKLKNIVDKSLFSFDDLIASIYDNRHFSLARYGDGEFNAILQLVGQNCDGHYYFAEMGRELGEVLKSNPKYYTAIHQSGRLEQATMKWIKKNRLLSRKWAINEIFHIPLRDNHIAPLWYALGGERVIIIAPEYVSRQTVLKGANFIAIPGVNTYVELPRILKGLEKTDFTGTRVLICASMCAPLIVDHLYKQYGETATFIDFGSTFDPFTGKPSRSFHRSVII